MSTDPYVIIRSRGAGVFAGYLTSRAGDEVHLTQARRIWYWAGAATLSQLAVQGTSKPDLCRFPPPVPAITILGVCEVIGTSAAAKASIEAVPAWSSR